MNIKSIASSSAGCAYIVESGGYSLLIECGVSLKRIRAALNHDLSRIVGCLVSHDHADHAGFLPQLEKETSIPIYCTEGTLKRFELSGACHPIKHKEVLTPEGVFRVMPFELDHDVQCFGFFIFTRYEKLLYITDTGSIKDMESGKDYTFPCDIGFIMIEANHSFEKLIDSEVNNAAKKRICETHLSIDDVAEFVSRHPDLEEIWLLHLSDRHSDAEKFKEMVVQSSGVPVFVADK